MAYPTLESLKYAIKYGTEHSHGTYALQTSIILTKMSAVPSTSVSNGVIGDPPKEGSLRAVVGPRPQMRNGVPLLCLTSVPAAKETVQTSKWEYYVDIQETIPYVRIVENSYLYLHVDVLATWIEDAEGKNMHDEIKAAEAKMYAVEGAENVRLAEEERARLQCERKSAEARLARDKAKQMERAAKKKSDDDQHAKQHADEEVVSDKLVKKRADDLAESNQWAKEAAESKALRYHEAPLAELAMKKAAVEREAEKEAEGKKSEGHNRTEY